MISQFIRLAGIPEVSQDDAIIRYEHGIVLQMYISKEFYYIYG